MSANKSARLETPAPWFRDPREPSVLVLDGFGLSASVSRGHLVLSDGLGRQRRERRRLPRAQRTVRRILILGKTGHVSLEAVRWCHDTGIALLQLDNDGTLLLTAGGSNGRDDPRLRRAQALAATTATGLTIARQLIGAKVQAQARTLDAVDLSGAVAAAVRECVAEVEGVATVAECLEVEARAANLYFGAWAGQVSCQFADQERAKVPDHWTLFAARGSILHRGGRSPRSAADPINALLNYGYGLLEAETTLAPRALGLDPGLGILHTDKPNRDSLALDVMEPVRPHVDQRTLQILQTRRFHADDFQETPQGSCRLGASLTHQLAAELPGLAREVAVHAEMVARHLATSSGRPIEVRTPLSGTRKSNAQTPGAGARRRARGQQQPAAAPRLSRTCQRCGSELASSRRKLCDACWNVRRRDLAAQRIDDLHCAAEQRRADGGPDPSQTEQARARRTESLLELKRAEREWTPTPEDRARTLEWFAAVVLPALREVPLATIQDQTGLSNSAASRIRRGVMTPHRRHWATLHSLADLPRGAIADSE